MAKCLIVFILMFGACSDSKQSNDKKQIFDTRIHYFNDINLFNLEGIREIEKPFSYPYIEITYMGDTGRNISYHTSKEIVVHRNYKNYVKYWRSTYSLRSDTSVETVYEYVMPDKIVTLNYYTPEDSELVFLTEAAVLSRWKEVTYIMPKDTKTAPEFDAIRNIYHKAEYIYIREIRISDSILRLSEQRTDMPYYHGQTCYNVGSHSYFWWHYFGFASKTIKCP